MFWKQQNCLSEKIKNKTFMPMKTDVPVFGQDQDGPTKICKIWKFYFN